MASRRSKCLPILLFTFAFAIVSSFAHPQKAGSDLPPRDGFSSRSARRLSQDSWIDPFQEQLPGAGSVKSVFESLFGSRPKTEVQLAVEEGRKRLEIVSAAMAKRAKALGGDLLTSMQEEVVSKEAAELAAKVAVGEAGDEVRRGGRDDDALGRKGKGGRNLDREEEGQERKGKKGKGGKLSPLELAKSKSKKEKNELYVEGPLEEEDRADDREKEFLIVEEPDWEEAITNEFVRQYVKELQGDYEGLDDVMHFQIDRVESQIREYARAQADAVWKAWEEKVGEEKRKSGLPKKNTSTNKSKDQRTMF